LKKCVRFEGKGKGTSEFFMIHVLNSLTPDYDFELALLKKRIGDTNKSLNVGETIAGLSLRY
jgi:hypothetical protein